MNKRLIKKTRAEFFLKNISLFYSSFWIVSFIFLLASCSQKSTQVILPVETPEYFSSSGNDSVPDKWWLVFENQELNTLVDSALASNLSLKSAWQRLKEAQAIIKRESGARYPTVDGSFDAVINNRQSEFQQSQRFRLGLYADYEIDLWGRIGAGIEAEQQRTNAVLNDYRAASLSISAEIVRTYFQIQEAKNHVELTNQQVEINENLLKLLKVRFGSGQVRSVDILRQTQLLEATKEQKIYAESNFEVLKHRLAVLLGKAPQEEFNFSFKALPELPALPETGIPAELINRRPDVKSAFQQVQAADRDLAVAIANKYPRLTLSASTSTASYNIEDLFNDWGRSIAGSLLVPIFSGRELNAEVDRAEAVKMQRLYEYGEAVLTAFQEVEDALVLEEKQAESIRNIERQVELMEKTNKQLRAEYLNGMSNYLDVLTASHQEQQLRRNLLIAKLQLLEYRIALYRSLAGGFETEREQLSMETDK